MKTHMDFHNGFSWYGPGFLPGILVAWACIFRKPFGGLGLDFHKGVGGLSLDFNNSFWWYGPGCSHGVLAVWAWILRKAFGGLAMDYH